MSGVLLRSPEVILAAILVLHGEVINSDPYNVIQVIDCNRYSTVGIEMTTIGTLVPEI